MVVPAEGMGTERPADGRPDGSGKGPRAPTGRALDLAVRRPAVVRDARPRLQRGRGNRRARSGPIGQPCMRARSPPRPGHDGTSSTPSCSSVDDGHSRAASRSSSGPVVLSESADGTGAARPATAPPCWSGCSRSASGSLPGKRRGPAAVARGLRGRCGRTPSRSRSAAAIDPRYNQPVPLRGRVRLLSDGRFVYAGKEFTGEEASMGRAAVVETDRAVSRSCSWSSRSSPPIRPTTAR